MRVVDEEEVARDAAHVGEGLDVRVVVETDDGALIYITYEGRADWSEGPGTKPIYMAPKFETSDERYTWLNAVQAVGKGQLGAGTVSYEIAEVR